MSGKEGSVFILMNDAMPGFARIDFTAKDDVAARVLKINQSALPVPFRIYMAASVYDWKALQQTLRFLFREQFDPDDPEYFTGNPELLRAAIEPAASAVHEFSDEEIGISAAKRSQMDRLRSSHEALKFMSLNAAPGTILYFSKDPSISCTALENGLVKFEGKELSPAIAARQAMRKLGFEWNELAGTDYWTPLGSSLGGNAKAAPSAMRMEAEMPEAPIVPNEVDDSPVVFVRNTKL
ncbi:hypothetical protein [Erythrobacter rubeus]|uniref:Uncharacterized protein n=1 Tax=Erythrobacter rubeus TaxID=2760803 RepID=A0ABR8KNW7_9SPHN|nr:hypothetical protein [Erythrobacter rubeus]MBD2841012.1 hypothetical protein [Erythrobacter rubeus]